MDKWHQQQIFYGSFVANTFSSSSRRRLCAKQQCASSVFRSRLKTAGKPILRFNGPHSMLLSGKIRKEQVRRGILDGIFDRKTITIKEIGKKESQSIKRQTICMIDDEILLVVL